VEDEGEGAVDAEGVEGGGEQGGEQVGAEAAAGEQQQSFEEHAGGGDVNHPTRQGGLEEGDPAGGLGAAEGGAEVLEQDDGDAEDGGLCEAVAEFASAVGGGSCEDRTEGVGGWGMGWWRGESGRGVDEGWGSRLVGGSVGLALGETGRAVAGGVDGVHEFVDAD
jgi:hypothetical protein